MNTYPSSQDNEPMMWLRGYAIYAAHFIVLIYVCTMIITTVVMGTGAASLLQAITFSSADVLSGQVWQIFTYGLVNPPSLGFVIEMFMIAVFGRELEKFFGRRTFLQLYACLYAVTPLLFTVIGKWLPLSLAGATGAFALFIAFATLYPDAVMMFNLLAKWVALVLVGIYTLIHFSQQNVTGLISLWTTVGFAYAFVRYEQGRLTLPSLKSSSGKKNAGSRSASPAKPSAPGKTSANEIDALLDKIARSGLHSLTVKERATLEEFSRVAHSKKQGVQGSRSP